MQVSKKWMALPIALFSFQTLAASEFNGYIVKLKNTNNLTVNVSSLSKFGKVEKLTKTEFGTFVKVTSKSDLLKSNSLLKNPNIEYVEPNWIIKVSD